jgi:hypothetical protein
MLETVGPSKEKAPERVYTSLLHTGPFKGKHMHLPILWKLD